MKDLILKFWSADEIPPGARILTIATAIRWVGWGFAESLIPVFIFMFAKSSFASASLIKSAYDVAFILALPLVGLLADRMKATTLVLIGLSLYIIVGTSYFFAGFTGLAVFIVISRAFNGLGFAFDAVGRETYIRRHTPSTRLATVFGYFDSIANFWWAAAAIVGIFLIKFFPIHWLLFLIVPTTLVAMIVISTFATKWDISPDKIKKKLPSYRELLSELGLWNWQLKAVVGFNFFVSFAWAIIAFFLPIQLYTEGSGYAPIILMGVVLTIPTFFGFFLGKWFDKQGMRAFLYGMLFFGVLVALLGSTTIYGCQIAIAFVIGVILELISVGSNELVTVYADPEHFGRVDGLMRSIADIGALAGPILAGILIDLTGNRVTYWALSLVIFALTIGFGLIKQFGMKHHQEKLAMRILNE